MPLTLAAGQSAGYSVVFAPKTAGSVSGNIVLSSDSATTNVTLAGTGVPPGDLTTNPTSFDFGQVVVGNTSSQTETVKNTGDSVVQISQVAVSGPGYSISGIATPVTLVAGQSTSFSVMFAPKSAGTFNGTVSLTSDASNPNLSVSLTGSSVAGTQGTLNLSPNPVNVGNVVLGLSGAQTGTLTATGANVVVSSVSLGGTNPNEFSISGLSFPVTVTTSQPVNFTVQFTPGATGAASAMASFTSNASDPQVSATVSGTGTPPPVHTVSLSWSASGSPDIAGYNIYRAIYAGSCGAYSKIDGLDPVTTYTDTSVTDGTSYCYATTAVNSSNEESGYSNIAAPVQIPAP